MIDLDSYCLANPARDLGNFLAYLCWKAIRQPEHAQFVERAGRAFLEGYLNVHADIDERWLSVYQAAWLLKIAGRRFRSLSYPEWPLITHLIQLAGLYLNEVSQTRSVARRLEVELSKRSCQHSYHNKSITYPI